MSRAVETNKITPFFVHEIQDDIWTELKVGERQFCNSHNDSFVPVLYHDDRLYIQTYRMMVVYGLTSYVRKSDKEIKYNLHLSLRPSTNDVKLFATFLRNMDKWAESYRSKYDDTYWSCIKDEDHNDPDTKSATFILKINTTHKKLLLDVIDVNGETHALPTPEEFRKLCPPKTWVHGIIMVNPLWFAGKKFGVSYRLVDLKIVELPKKTIPFRDYDDVKR